jgi:hypothetical protein
VTKPAARKREPYCARTLRYAARLAGKWTIPAIGEYSRTYNLACADIARYLRRQARALESRQPRKKARGR